MKEIMSFTPADLAEKCEREGFQSFRAEQIYNWLYCNLVKDPEKMKNLPADLQSMLINRYRFELLSRQDLSRAEDNTIKFLWQTDDSEYVEGVLIPGAETGRYTACVSVQLGCNIGCAFCASGLSGKARDLKSAEIVEQIWRMKKFAREEGSRMSNVVFMGMGEPFLNYENVCKTLEIIKDEKGFNIGSRRITVSTAGVVPRIVEFARSFPQIVLAVSLHAADDELRSRLVPLNKKYSLAELHSALGEYQNITGRRITFEYVLFDGINDRRQDAENLADYLRDLKCHINLIPANDVSELEFKPSGRKKIREFKHWLEAMNLPVTIRKSRGENEKAACGQLRRDRGGF